MACADRWSHQPVYTFDSRPNIIYIATYFVHNFFSSERNRFFLSFSLRFDTNTRSSYRMGILYTYPQRTHIDTCKIIRTSTTTHIFLYLYFVFVRIRHFFFLHSTRNALICFCRDAFALVLPLFFTHSISFCYLHWHRFFVYFILNTCSVVMMIDVWVHSYTMFSVSSKIETIPTKFSSVLFVVSSV